ncbi:MAG: DUF4203 domain-containing protein [Anaerolineae bacterium]|nr:DUF4203 domain-containing protein [Anaerolineae bacterium]
MTGTSVIIIGLVSIAIGLVSCFYGYAVFRVVLVVLGFLLGYAVGTALVAGRAELTVLLVGLGAGLIGAAIMYGLYVLGVMLAGGLFGANVASALILALNLEGALIPIIILIGVLIGAVIAYGLNKWMIVIGTAFNGASSIIYGAGLLIPTISVLERRGNPILMTVIWLLIGVIGVAIQYRIFGDDLND